MRVGPHPHTGLQTFTWMIEGEVLEIQRFDGARAFVSEHDAQSTVFGNPGFSMMPIRLPNGSASEATWMPSPKMVFAAAGAGLTTWEVAGPNLWELAEKLRGLGACVVELPVIELPPGGLRLDVKPGGALAMLLPMKLWRSMAGGGVRQLLHGTQRVRAIEDWSEAPAAFDAADPVVAYNPTAGEFLVVWASTVPSKFTATAAGGERGHNRRLFSEISRLIFSISV